MTEKAKARSTKSRTSLVKGNHYDWMQIEEGSKDRELGAREGISADQSYE